MGPSRFTDTQFTDSRFTDKTVYRQDSSPTRQFTDRPVHRQINFSKNNEIQHKLRQN